MQRQFKYIYGSLVHWISVVFLLIGLMLSGCDVFSKTDELISEKAKAAAYIPLVPLGRLTEEGVHSDVSTEGRLLEAKQEALESKTAQIRMDASTQGNVAALRARAEALKEERERIRQEAAVEN